MKKIHLIIILILLLLSLTACLPPVDKTTEYKEKDNEFKEYILAKLLEIETAEYNRVSKSFSISYGEETNTYRYEIVYGDNEINVYNSFYKTIDNIENGEWKVYTYKGNKCYNSIYSDRRHANLISEDVEEISLEKFLELYERKEYAKYNLDLTDAKVTKIVKESMQAGWYYEVKYIKYNIQFNPNKEFHFEVLGNEMIFNNCTISLFDGDIGYVRMYGKSGENDCTAAIFINMIHN